MNSPKDGISKIGSNDVDIMIMMVKIHDHKGAGMGLDTDSSRVDSYRR